MAAMTVHVQVHVVRRGRLLDFFLDGRFAFTKDLAELFRLSEEQVQQAVAILDARDREKAGKDDDNTPSS